MATEPLVFSVSQSVAHAHRAILLGRNDDNDIVFPEGSISGVHAALQFTDEPRSWWLMDWASKNGTCVAEVSLEPKKWVALPDRSRVRLGHVDVRFLLPGSFIDYLIVRSQ
jgi:pSer/pThr/pTyr-binding forkhead associated (FHA) protein